MNSDQFVNLNGNLLAGLAKAQADAGDRIVASSDATAALMLNLHKTKLDEDFRRASLQHQIDNDADDNAIARSALQIRSNELAIRRTEADAAKDESAARKKAIQEAAADRAKESRVKAATDLLLATNKAQDATDKMALDRHNTTLMELSGAAADPFESAESKTRNAERFTEARKGIADITAKQAERAARVEEFRVKLMTAPEFTPSLQGDLPSDPQPDVPSKHSVEEGGLGQSADVLLNDAVGITPGPAVVHVSDGVGQPTPMVLRVGVSPLVPAMGALSAAGRTVHSVIPLPRDIPGAADPSLVTSPDGNEGPTGPAGAAGPMDTFMADAYSIAQAAIPKPPPMMPKGVDPLNGSDPVPLTLSFKGTDGSPRIYAFGEEGSTNFSSRRMYEQVLEYVGRNSKRDGKAEAVVDTTRAKSALDRMQVSPADLPPIAYKVFTAASVEGMPASVLKATHPPAGAEADAGEKAKALSAFMGAATVEVSKVVKAIGDYGSDNGRVPIPATQLPQFQNYMKNALLKRYKAEFDGSPEDGGDPIMDAIVAAYPPKILKGDGTVLFSSPAEEQASKTKVKALSDNKLKLDVATSDLEMRMNPLAQTTQGYRILQARTGWSKEGTTGHNPAPFGVKLKGIADDGTFDEGAYEGDIIKGIQSAYPEDDARQRLQAIKIIRGVSGSKSDTSKLTTQDDPSQSPVLSFSVKRSDIGLTPIKGYRPGQLIGPDAVPEADPLVPIHEVIESGEELSTLDTAFLKELLDNKDSMPLLKVAARAASVYAKFKLQE